eukprot:s266_g38.t2
MWHASPRPAMTLLPSSPKGYVSPKDEELGDHGSSGEPDSSESSCEESDSEGGSSMGICRQLDDERGSDNDARDGPCRLERTRLWRREVVERNIKFGATIILMENIFLSFQTFYAIINKNPWANWVPYLITYAIEWPILLYVIKYPRIWLYLIILGFDALISLVAADPMMLDPMMISDESVEITGYQVLYFDMIYILMSVMYYPSLTSLIIFSLARTLVYTVYLIVVLFHCSSDVAEVHLRQQILDTAVGVLSLLVVNTIAIAQKKHLGKLQRRQAEKELERRKMCSKMFTVFNSILPPFLVKRILRNPSHAIGDRVERVSILFILLCDFERYSMTMTPVKLFRFLNDTFIEIDVICATHGVTKIETVGEEYVCGVGVSPTDQDEDHLTGHTGCLSRLLLVAWELKNLPRTTFNSGVKMGIHTGPVVAGVVGKRLPRFRLFGDTMNTAARMMQKGLPGEVQFGDETLKYLPSWASTKPRGYVAMKGKGNVMTHLLRGEPPDEISGIEATRQTSEKLSIPTVGAMGDRPVSPPRRDHRFHTDVPMVEHSGPRASDRLDHRAQTQPGNGHLRRPEGRKPSTGSPNRLAGIMKELLGMNEDQTDDTDYDGEDILEVAREVTKSQSSQIIAWWGTSGTLRRVLQRLTDCRRWASPRGFPDNEEEDFLVWFHNNYTCSRLLKEVRKQALSSFLVTMGTTVYSVFKLGGFENSENIWFNLLKIKWFLLCRITIWFIILAFWHVVSHGYLQHGDVLRHQAVLSAVKHVLGILIYCSYGILLKIMPSHGFYTWSRLCPRFSLLGISDNILPLALFMEFGYWMTKAQTLFLPGFIGVCITAAILIFLGGQLVFDTGGLLNYLNVVSLFNAFRIFSMEWVLRQRHIAMRRVEVMQEKIEGILRTLMPPMVIEEIKRTATFVSHNYRSATIAQSDLVGFTTLASSREPMEVVRIISDLFDKFDDLADQYHIYKVETVGDAYIAGQADNPLTSCNQPLLVVLFGIQMTMVTRTWSAQRGENISCRVGVHTGECVGGMVGESMQRYHLFGDLMRRLEILEATAPTGQVQVSRACKHAVETQIQRHPQEVADVMEHVIFQSRAEQVLTSSKGEIHDYSEVGGPTYLARPAPKKMRGVMRLVTFGAPSLEWQLGQAQATFGQIPRQGQGCGEAAPSFQGVVPYPSSSLQQLLRMQGLTPKPELHLVFPMQNLRPWIRSNPTAYLQHILTFAGKDSLLLALRDQLNVASSLSVNREDSSAGSKIVVSLSLLPEGVERLPAVLDAFFSFIARARSGTSNAKLEVLRSLAESAQVGYDWSALEDASRAAFEVADDMTKLGASDLLVADNLILEPDVTKVDYILNRLRPEHMLLVLVDTEQSSYWQGGQPDASAGGGIFPLCIMAPDDEEKPHAAEAQAASQGSTNIKATGHNATVATVKANPVVWPDSDTVEDVTGGAEAIDFSAEAVEAHNAYVI